MMENQNRSMIIKIVHITIKESTNIIMPKSTIISMTTSMIINMAIK